MTTIVLFRYLRSWYVLIGALLSPLQLAAGHRSLPRRRCPPPTRRLHPPCLPRLNPRLPSLLRPWLCQPRRSLPLLNRQWRRQPSPHIPAQRRRSPLPHRPTRDRQRYSHRLLHPIQYQVQGCRSCRLQHLIRVRAARHPPSRQRAALDILLRSHLLLSCPVYRRAHLTAHSNPGSGAHAHPGDRSAHIPARLRSTAAGGVLCLLGPGQSWNGPGGSRAGRPLPGAHPVCISGYRRPCQQPVQNPDRKPVAAPFFLAGWAGQRS
jgi:hypothetical protein